MTDDFTTPDTGDCSPEDFRQAMDRATEYVVTLPSQPAKPSWNEGQIRSRAGALPEQGHGLQATMDFFEEAIAPGMQAWNNPGFMGFFGVSAPAPALTASFLTTAHNANRMVTAANPAAVELDELAGAWFKSFLNIPEAFESQLFYAASQSHQHVLGAAINQRTGGDFRRKGLTGIGEIFRVYKSKQAHFFADKNAIGTGLGLDNVVDIEVDADGAMDVAALAAAVEADVAQGFTPLMVVSTVGTTSSNAVDDVESVADVCERHGLFHYVDAAYGGAFAALPEFDWIRRGWERADAICVNPHKQLMAPLGSSLLFMKDRDALRRTFMHGGAYIPEHPETRPDPMDYTMLCGMPMNSPMLIFLMHAFGAEGLRARLRNTVRLSKAFAAMIEEDPGFEIIAPHPFTTVCFRARHLDDICPDEVVDDFNTRVGRHVMESGQVFLSPTKLGGRTALRLTIGNINTSDEHVAAAFKAVSQSVETMMHFLSFRMAAQLEQKTSQFWCRNGQIRLSRSGLRLETHSGFGKQHWRGIEMGG